MKEISFSISIPNYKKPNVGAEPRLKAAAQRRLEGVGSSAWFGRVFPKERKDD
jgi:hypothetical protein